MLFSNFISKNLLIFSVVFFFVLSSSSVFADSLSDKLNEIEKNYYGYTFSGDNATRLARVENAIYGSTGKQSESARVEKIYKDLGLSANNTTKPVSTGDLLTQSQNIGPKADAGIKYPIVDKLEQKTFNTVYANDDIYVRLSRLEKKIFPNSNKSTLSLNERVDALRDNVLGGTNSVAVDIDPMTEEIVLENGQKYYGDEDAKSYFNKKSDDEYSNYNYYSYENSKNPVPEKQSFEIAGDGGEYAEHYAQSYDLDILEKSLLGQRYTSETPSKRLARLESKVFQRTFNDDEDARIQRLLAVTTAQKTSQEYDSNKWARRLNTGMQIGSILLMVLAMIL